MSYEHTQQGRMYLITIGVAVLICLVQLALLGSGAAVIFIVTAAVIAFVGWLFSRLTVSVDDQRVRVAFGPGWPRRTIRHDDIVAARPVRNTWWHGWGIRLVANGWMFNVWGLDAVELELTSGRVFRIGTDEPTALADAVTARLPR